MGAQLGLLPDAIEERAMEWADANPTVFPMFCRFALEAMQAGHRNYSAKGIFERIRWHVEVETKGDTFKVNNDFTAVFARWFHAKYPEHDGFFHTRLRKGE